MCPLFRLFVQVKDVKMHKILITRLFEENTGDFRSTAVNDIVRFCDKADTSSHVIGGVVVISTVV